MVLAQRGESMRRSAWPIKTTRIPSHLCKGNRRVVASVIMFDPCGRIYLVESAKAPPEHAWRVPLQERAEIGDKTLEDLAIRGLYEEVGVNEADIALFPEALHFFTNSVPVRAESERQLKLTFVLFGLLEDPDITFTPQQGEVRQVVRVDDPADLVDILAQNRPDKYWGTLKTCTEAIQAGLWSEQLVSLRR